MSENETLDVSAVLAVTKCSRQTLMKRVAGGDFPPPLNPRSSRRIWSTAQVRAWLEGKYRAEAAHATA